MKKLTFILLPVFVALTACEDQRKTEVQTIGSAPIDPVEITNPVQQKAISGLYNYDALMEVRETLQGRMDNLPALKMEANKKFKDLTALKSETTDSAIIKVIAVKAERDEFSVVKGISMRLKINGQDVGLSGTINSTGLLATLNPEKQEAGLIAQSQDALKSEKIQAKALCVIDTECKRILSIIRVGKTQFRVIVTDRREATKINVGSI